MAKHQPFNLIRWFSVAGLASVASISIILALLLSRFLTHSMLEQDAIVSMEFVQGVVLAEKSAHYFLDRRHDQTDERLEDTFAHLSHMPDVLRTNVYSRDRVLIWSSTNQLIGQRFGANEELDESLAGQLVYSSGFVGDDEHEKEEHALLAKGTFFVESYIPVRDGPGEVVGVVELYKVPRALHEAIRTGQRLVWVGAILGGLFLYGMLFWIVRRADTVMRVQQERLVEAETLAAIGEMAAAVAHGIRNPLSAMRSSAELMLDLDSGPATEPARDIVAEVDRVEQWVRDLLTYARPMDTSSGKVDINEIARENLGQVAREMERRGIRAEAELDDSLPKARGDSILMRQVLHNLISNALEAMTGPGSLAVRTRLSTDGNRIVVTVADSGPGISRDELAKIFRPFHTTKPRGLGLGLPLAKNIVERYGGAISAASEPGRGTTVTLQLPVAS